jgi:YD repeat-containing protein
MKNSIYLISCLLFVFFSSGYAEKSLSYDVNGNVIKYILPNAGEISYSYDPLNRLTSIDYQGGESIQYVYDCNDNLIEVDSKQGKTVYAYDSLNRMVSAEISADVSLCYEYDASNKIIKIIYPNKEEVNYLYDERGRLYQVCDPGGTTQYEYDNVTNLVIRERLANGVITDFSYDAFLRISAVSHKRGNGSLIVRYKFSYDRNDQCVLFEEATEEGTKSTSYTYDDLNRLISTICSDGTFEKYVYDAAGNRLTKESHLETIHYEYDQNNKLIRSGDITCQYDVLGNLVKKNHRKRKSI